MKAIGNRICLRCTVFTWNLILNHLQNTDHDLCESKLDSGLVQLYFKRPFHGRIRLNALIWGKHANLPQFLSCCGSSFPWLSASFQLYLTSPFRNAQSALIGELHTHTPKCIWVPVLSPLHAWFIIKTQVCVFFCLLLSALQFQWPPAV